ncbi:MAG: hypothetical protein AB7V43_22485, partial [Acidimicrobiia bacterium]
MNPTRSIASLAAEDRLGLWTLCDALGADLQQWRDGSCPQGAESHHSGPLLLDLVDEMPAEELDSLRSVIADRAIMGHQIVVVIGPASAAHLSVLVPGTWAADEVLMSIDRDDPLVDRPVVTAVTMDGLMLEMPEAVAIHGVGEPMATVADGPDRDAVVAVMVPLGRSVVTVIGSTDMLGDHWLLDADNATFLSRTLSPGRHGGDDGDAAHRIVDAVVPQRLHVHAQPIVARAPEGWLRSDGVPKPHVAVGSPEFMRCARRTSRQLPFEVWDALSGFVDEP